MHPIVFTFLKVLEFFKQLIISEDAQPPKGSKKIISVIILIKQQVTQTQLIYLPNPVEIAET